MIRHVRKGIKKIWAVITLISLELAVVVSAFFVALIAFVFIARMIFWKKKEDIDIKVFDFLANYVSDVNSNIMHFFTFLGTHWFLIPLNLLLVLYFSIIKKHRWYSIKIPVISLSSVLIMFLLKQIFHRNRPLIPLFEEARGLSFPSGHAMMSFSFYGLLIYLVWENIENKIAKWLLTLSLFILIIFIGLSRVYLRVHYASDVLAGFSLGLMWLILALFILNRMERISRKEIDRLVEKEPETAPAPAEL